MRPHHDEVNVVRPGVVDDLVRWGTEPDVRLDRKVGAFFGRQERVQLFTKVARRLVERVPHPSRFDRPMSGLRIGRHVVEVERRMHGVGQLGRIPDGDLETSLKSVGARMFLGMLITGFLRERLTDTA